MNMLITVLSAVLSALISSFTTACVIIYADQIRHRVWVFNLKRLKHKLNKIDYKLENQHHYNGEKTSTLMKKQKDLNSEIKKKSRFVWSDGTVERRLQMK